MNIPFDRLETLGGETDLEDMTCGVRGGGRLRPETEGAYPARWDACEKEQHPVRDHYEREREMYTYVYTYICAYMYMYGIYVYTHGMLTSTWMREIWRRIAPNRSR